MQLKKYIYTWLSTFVMLTSLLLGTISHTTNNVRAAESMNITNFVLTSESGASFHNASLDFDFEAIDYQPGQSFSVTLEEPLQFLSIAPFPLLTDAGETVGTCEVQDYEMNCTFNENVLPLVRGHIQIWTSFSIEPSTEERVVPVSIVINGTTFNTDVHLDPDTPIGSGSPVMKAGSIGANNTVNYYLLINTDRQTYTNAIISDIADSSVQINVPSITIHRTELDIWGQSLPGSEVDVTSQYSILQTASGFSIDFGNTITSDAQYVIRYSATIIDTDAGDFVNQASLSANEITTFSTTNRIQNSGGQGSANGDGAQIEIYKIGAETQAPLSGATFTVTNANGVVVATITTDLDGIARTRRNLNFGTYTIQEQVAPNGYVLSDKLYTITVDTTTPRFTASIEIENQKYPPNQESPETVPNHDTPTLPDTGHTQNSI